MLRSYFYCVWDENERSWKCSVQVLLYNIQLQLQDSVEAQEEDVVYLSGILHLHHKVYRFPDHQYHSSA